MRRYPVPDPGTPDLRSPARYVAWLAGKQWTSLAAGAFWGITWLGSQAFVPLAVGKAIDRGVRGHSTHQLFLWAGVLAALGALSAFGGLMRHRCAVSNFLFAGYRTQQVVVRHVVRLGASLGDRMSASDATSVSAIDSRYVAGCLDVTARATGSVFSFIAVAILLLGASVPLGLVVLLGVPLLVLGLGPLLKPLHHQQQAQRAVLSEASALAADTVSGLRVLRGIGGEAELLARYKASSQRVRQAGVKLAGVEATLDAMQVLLPGIFVVTLTVIGARLAIDGKITAGQLVSFYGYAAFLVTPLRTMTEMADAMTRALVAAGRIISLLSLEPVREEPESAETSLYTGVLVDEESGARIQSGQLTAVVSADPVSSTRLSRRLGALEDSTTTIGDIPLRDLPLAEVRERVLVSDQTPWIFRGELRRVLDPRAQHDDAQIMVGLEVASAADVLDSLSDGLSTEIEERARELSGGQRQRLVLARALLAEPAVLILDEPTSSVDAHTESRIARRIKDHRAGLTTVLLSTSPLVLEQADTVLLLSDGRVVAEGSHAELLRDPAYRAVVAREDVLT